MPDEVDLVGTPPSTAAPAAPTGHNAVPGAREHLRAFVQRIERLEEDKQAIAEDIKQVYGEAKAMGFDTKALRQVIRERKQDAAERQEFESVLDLYRAALGMIQNPDD